MGFKELLPHGEAIEDGPGVEGEGIGVQNEREHFAGMSMILAHPQSAPGADGGGGVEPHGGDNFGRLIREHHEFHRALEVAEEVGEGALVGEVEVLEVSAGAEAVEPQLQECIVLR